MINSLNFPQSISWLDGYRSPDYEQSLYKGIPIAYRYHPAVLRLIRGDNERGVRLRPRYRGKSKPAIGYKRHQSYVTEEFADTFALYPVSNYRAETSLSSRKADTSSMNEPITYPVGNGNVIGSHSAQDFVWAGRAEGGHEQATGETATHTPMSEEPYTGPITEPLGSEIHFGADGKRDVSMPMLIGGFATLVGIGGLAGILIGGQKFVEDIPWYLGGGIIRGVKASWDSKDGANKILMGMTYVALLYLGQAAFFATYSYRKSVAGRLGA